MQVLGARPGAGQVGGGNTHLVEGEPYAVELLGVMQDGFESADTDVRADPLDDTSRREFFAKDLRVSSRPLADTTFPWREAGCAEPGVVQPHWRQ